MGIASCFEVKEEARTTFIEKSIIEKLPDEKRDSARQKINDIVNNYEGQDVNALSTLAYAAEKNRFDEFTGKLETHYNESLQFVHPEARKLQQVPGALRAEYFFMRCYKELGIKPSTEKN